MKRKMIFAPLVVFLMLFGLVGSVYAAEPNTIAVNSPNQVIQHVIKESGHVTFFYYNKTTADQTVVFRVSNKDLNNEGLSDISGFLTGNVLMSYPDGRVVKVDDLGGTHFFSGYTPIPPGAALVVNLDRVSGVTRDIGLKIRFMGE